MILHSLFSPQNNIVEGDLPTIIRMALAGQSSTSGISITPESALRTAAVYACIKVLGEDVGKIPLILYRRTHKNGRDGRERATDHYLYNLMQVKPNHLQTPIVFRECITAATALRGNGIGIISRIGSKVISITPVHPDNVTIKLDNSGNRIYCITLKSGISREYQQADILHIMGLTINGYEGVSPITYARDTIGLAQATERHGSKTFSNGARMGGILSIPGKLKQPGAAQRIGDEFDQVTSGENAHKTLVLEDGMKWEKVTMTADDAQYLETRQFQIPEIARFWRMPLHKIGDLTRATFSNIEHQSIEYVVDTLAPWLTRWEQALNMALLSTQEQEEYYFEFLVDGLLRGDIKSRYEAYSRGILSGFLTRNEVRAMENREWLEGLDEPLTPSNMALGADPVSDSNKAPDEQKQTNAEIRQELKQFSRELDLFLSDRYSNSKNEVPNITVNNPPIDVNVSMSEPQKIPATKTVTHLRDEITGEIISSTMVEESKITKTVTHLRDEITGEIISSIMV